MYRRYRLTIFLGALLAGSPLAAQSDSSRLTLDRIFNSREFASQRFGPARWLDDSSYTTLERSAGGEGVDIVRYDAASGNRTVLVAASALVPAGADQPLSLQGYAWSPDGQRLLIFTNSQRVWRQNTRGDYWVLDLANNRLHQLGGDAAPSTLMFATFSPDGHRVAYVREHDLYVENLDDGHITRLTSDGSTTIINGTFDWVYEEEFSLRNGFRWSPDGRRLAYWQLNAEGVRDYTLINDTDSLYSYTIPVQYPKAGTTNSAVRVGVVSADGGPTTWMNVPGDNRNFYIARMDWAASSDEIWFQDIPRHQNQITVYLGNAATGAIHPILVERDSAWLDAVNDLEWIENGRRFTWPSERDGWRRLYLVSRDGRQVTPITPTGQDVTTPGAAFGAQLILGEDPAGGWIYYTASPRNATQLYLFRSRMNGRGRPEQLTPANQTGLHTYQIAPGGHWAIHSWSSFGTPPVTELVRLPSHQVVRTLVDNAQLKARVAGLRRGRMEFFQVPADDSLPLDAWIMYPPDFDSTRTWPILFQVYGEPASQTVLDAWGGGTYLWHLMLTQMGYIVASVDNRGTPGPRGRDFRKSVYGEIGVQSSADQAAAARAIIERPGIDGTRVGIWGWSGGGAMTLNMMFRHPELYEVGMSVAPVTDQRFYDTIYQERYMGTPQENPDGYRRGSPINFASNLEGDLLLVHGSGDDNVHYQNTEALVNALVAADKPFTLMVYPNRSHCICEGRGTTLHLFSLLTRYLGEHLPAGAR